MAIMKTKLQSRPLFPQKNWRRKRPCWYCWPLSTFVISVCWCCVFVLHLFSEGIDENNASSLPQVHRTRREHQQEEKEREIPVTLDRNKKESSAIRNVGIISASFPQQQQQQEEPLLPLLIVGGSDGSGTRAVTQALGQLGVPMLTDDHETLDVHGADLFRGQGWPPLVQHVLRWTHSADYAYPPTTTTGTSNNNTIPKPVQQLIEEQWAKLDRNWKRRVQQMRGRVETTQPGRLATKVHYGFKAPVAMLLLPFFAHFYKPQRIKFVHVVRDGRDVALSNNQSPVIKFYKAFTGRSIPSAPSSVTLAAMELWNDWNTQVSAWSTKHPQHVDTIVIRIEDLIQDRVRTLHRLAQFVGAPSDRLCCAIHKQQQQQEDLGASSVFSVVSAPKRRRKLRVVATRQATRDDDTTLEHAYQPPPPRQGAPPQQQQQTPPNKNSRTTAALQKRFGKWKIQLAKQQPALLRTLEERGHDGLALFGYLLDSSLDNNNINNSRPIDQGEESAYDDPSCPEPLPTYNHY